MLPGGAKLLNHKGGSSFQLLFISAFRLGFSLSSFFSSSLMSSPPDSPFPTSPSQIVPGSWPDTSTEATSAEPESPPQHLDQILSFHKRLSLSFSSPILMPSRSPLLAFSASTSGVAIGSQVTCMRLLSH